MTSRLHRLSELGQSVWIDFLSRNLLESGALARAIADDAVVGVTSNPTIFAKALSDGNAYDEQIATRAGGVNNGIEYGLMAAYAEGLNILHRANAGTEQRAGDAETAPLPDREYYRYAIDVAAVAEVWRRGSVVASWLLDLTADALAGLPDLSAFSGRVSDSGEGRWTVRAALDVGAPANVLSAALFDRFASRGEADFANQLLSAMRSQFGGHAEIAATTG